MALFKVKVGNGNTTEVKKHFDMIHVTPAQSARDFIRSSPIQKPGQLSENSRLCWLKIRPRV